MDHPGGSPRPTGGSAAGLSLTEQALRAAPRARRRDPRFGLALAAIVMLLGTLAAVWAHAQALESEMAGLRAGRRQVAGRATTLEGTVQQQDAQLSKQAADLQTANHNLLAVQRDLDDLSGRMARLDQHNAELRDALGLSGIEGAPPDSSPVVTATGTPAPHSLLPPAEGGEVGPLYSVSLFNPTPAASPTPAGESWLAGVRAQIASLRHGLDVHDQIEAELTSMAARRLQEWAQAGEDDSAMAPPVDVTLPPASEPVAAAPAPAPKGGAAKTPAKAVSHLPSGLPYYGDITSPFGWRSSPFVKAKVGFHKGMDIRAAIGTPVRATQAGRVLEAGWSDVYGRMVMLDHGAGWVTLYGHNSRLAVQAGDRVDQGEVIAYSGSTGMSTGPHIHYEVRHNDVPVDPARFR